jgi:restriction endonuclease S subunit
VIDETEEMISPIGVANSAAVLHPAGTVALSRTASVGFSCILGRDMATSQDFATWTCGPLLDPRFLLYSLRGQPEQIRERMIGSTHKTIYMPDIETLTTPLPPLETQRRIADFIEAECARIDSVVAARVRTSSMLAERRASAVAKLLQRYEAAPLKRLASLLPGFAFSSEEFAAEFPGPRLLRGVNVAIGRVDWRDAVRLRTEPDSRLKRYVLEENDVVVGMDRPFISGGSRIAIIDASSAGTLLVQRVCRLRFADSALAKIATAHLSGETFRDFVSHSLTGVSVPHLSDAQIGAFHVACPPVNERLEVACRLAAIDRSHSLASRSVERQVELLRERKQALITAAVAGQLNLAREIAEEAS